MKNIDIYDNRVKQCVVKVSKYSYTLKNTLFGCFRIEENEMMPMKQV